MMRVYEIVGFPQVFLDYGDLDTVMMFRPEHERGPERHYTISADMFRTIRDAFMGNGWAEVDQA